MCTLCLEAVLTKIRAIIQHFQFQEKTCVKNSVWILCYSCNNFERLFISLLLHNMLDGLTCALTSLRNKRKYDHPEHGLFCTSPPDWNSSAWNKEVWKIKERALEFCLKRSLDEQNKKDITPEGLQAPSHSLVVTTAWAKVGRLPICARKSLDV